MAHFAELDENNIVKQVIVVENYILLDSNNVEQEALGIAFCKKIGGENSKWVQTSYNGRFRNRYAGVGYLYLEEYDVFVPPKPEGFPSWILNIETFEWVPPIPKPNDDDLWSWNEANQNWDLIITDTPNIVYPTEPKPEDIPGYIWTFNPIDLEWFTLKLPDSPQPSSENLNEEEQWVWDYATESWIIIDRPILPPNFGPFGPENTINNEI